MRWDGALCALAALCLPALPGRSRGQRQGPVPACPALRRPAPKATEKAAGRQGKQGSLRRSNGALTATHPSQRSRLPQGASGAAGKKGQGRAAERGSEPGPSAPAAQLAGSPYCGVFGLEGEGEGAACGLTAVLLPQLDGAGGAGSADEPAASAGEEPGPPNAAQRQRGGRGRGRKGGGKRRGARGRAAASEGRPEGEAEGAAAEEQGSASAGTSVQQPEEGSTVRRVISRKKLSLGKRPREGEGAARAAGAAPAEPGPGSQLTPEDLEPCGAGHERGVQAFDSERSGAGAAD